MNIQAAQLTSDLIRWTGVAIAFTGSLLSAPEASRRYFHRARVIAKEAYGRVRSALAFPFRRERRAATFEAATETDRAFALGGGTFGAGEGWPWPSEAPDAQRIELLRQRTEELARRVSIAKQDLFIEHQHRDAAIDSVWRDATQQIQQAHERIEQQENLAVQIDYDGLPILGAGVALTGIPDELARFPFLIGLALTAAAFAYTVKMVCKAVAHNRRA